MISMISALPGLIIVEVNDMLAWWAPLISATPDGWDLGVWISSTFAFFINDIWTTTSLTYHAPDRCDFVSVSSKSGLLLKLATEKGQWLLWQGHCTQERPRCWTHHLPRSEPKWSSVTMCEWCPCGSPGKMDRACPLTTINKFYIYIFFFSAVVKLVTGGNAGGK